MVPKFHYRVYKTPPPPNKKIRPGLRRYVTFCNMLVFLWLGVNSPLLIHLQSWKITSCRLFSTALHIWKPSPPSASWDRAMPWWQRPT